MEKISTKSGYSILVVENLQYRIDFFKEFLKNHNVKFASSSDEAIENIKHHKFDILFLSHDLNGHLFSDSNEENTGYKVACYINKQQIEFNRIIIHTMNLHGANNISKLLSKAEFIPYNALTNI